MNLRDYQLEAVGAVREGFRTTGKRQVLMLPTAAGKTIIASYMIKNASSKGLRCLFVCDRIELIDQTSAIFYNDGIDHGVIQAQHPFYFPELNVQVCSIQTLSRRKTEKYDLLVIDECHALHSAHVKLMNENDGFVVGLSATPFAKGIGKHFDGLVKPVSVKFLIEKGFLSDFEAYGPSKPDLSGLKTVAGDFEANELGERVNKPKLVADIIGTWFKRAKGRKTICFATNIAHSKFIVREFCKRGIPAEHIDCYTGKGEDEKTRKEVIERFKTGETTVLSNVDILTKGFDYPEVSCVIQARPTKSLMIHIQQIGRGLRIAEGKEQLIILDHAGNHERLGFVDGPLPDFLDFKNKSNSEKKKEEFEREEPLPKPCPSCDFLKPAGIRKCPACGLVVEFAQEVETKKGELAKLQRKDRTEYSIADKQAFLGGLNSYFKDLYTRKGWGIPPSGCFGGALKMYEAKFGAKPPSTINWSAISEISKEVKGFITNQNIRHAKSNSYRK